MDAVDALVLVEMSKIKTEISIESCESFVVRRKRYSMRSWCTECERNSIFVRPTEVAFLSGFDLNHVVSLVCSNELHTQETARRGVFICLTSLCLLSLTPEVYEEDYEIIESLTDINEGEMLFLEDNLS